MKLIRLLVFSFFLFCAGRMYAQCPAITINPSAATICSGSSQTLSATASGTVNSYSWAPAAGLNTTAGPVVVASPTTTTTYTVTGTTNCGQSVTKTVAVSVTSCQSYCFTQSTGTYTAITSGTTLTPADNAVYSASLGFTFNFKGVNYTSCSVSTNGFITFGSTTPATTLYTPISATTAYGGAVSAMGTNLTNSGATGAEMRHQTSGTSPNRKFTMQWKNLRRNNGTVLSDVLNFQIILYEGSNKIDIVYGSNTSTSTASVDLQVGIRGAINADYTNRATTTNWGSTTAGTSNTATCRTSNSIMPSSGLTFSFAPSPAVSVTPTAASICPGTSATLTASGASTYSWAPSSGLNSTTASSVIASPTGSTTYTVTGTTNGCTASATSTVTVKSMPAISVNPSSTICSGRSATLTASGGTAYSWSTGANTASINVTPTASTNYTVTVTNGCTPTLSSRITVNTSPTASISASPSSTVCSGQSVTLTGSTSGGTSYSWSTGATTSAIAVSPTTNTTYTLTVTGDNGCTATAGITVTVVGPSVVNVSAAPSFTICNGTSTTLTASGASTYSWAPADGLSASTGSSVVASPTVTTVYSVTGTSSGCTSPPSTFTVTVNKCPKVKDYCFSQSTGTYTAITAGTVLTAADNNVTQATLGFTFNFNGVNYTSCAISTNGFIAFGSTHPATTLFTPISGTTAYDGAVSAMGADLTNSGATSPEMRCQTAGSSPNRRFIMQWKNWRRKSGTTALSDVLNFQIILYEGTNKIDIIYGSNTMASTSVNVEVGLRGSSNADYSNRSTTTNWSGTTSGTTNSAKCATSSSIRPASGLTFSYSPSPLVTVTPASVTLCNGASSTLTASGAGTYSWSPSAGLNATTGAVVIASPTATTTYTVTGTLNGCSAQQPVDVTVNSGGVVRIDASTQTVCQGGSSTLTAIGGAAYQWSPSQGLNTTTGPVVVATPTVATTYTVSASHQGGCSSSATVHIGVSSQPSASAGPDKTICSGSSTVLSASGGSSYEWIPADGLSNPFVSNPTASPATTTTYTVKVTGPGTCPNNTDEVRVTVNDGPEIMTSGDVGLCNDAGVTISASGGVSYLWSPATGLSNPASPSPLANPSVTTKYQVMVTNAAGCAGTGIVVVHKENAGSISISPSQIICAGSGVMLSVKGGISYNWSPATGLSCTNCESPTAAPNATTTYQVAVKTQWGCLFTKEVTVVVQPGLTVDAGPDQTLCYGKKTQLHATGASSYLWVPETGLSCTDCANPYVSITSNTTYTVYGSNDNCSSSDSVRVFVNKPSDASFQYRVFNCVVHFFAMVPGTYEWDFGDGSKTETIASPVHTYTGKGPYKVTLKLTDDCGEYTITKYIELKACSCVN